MRGVVSLAAALALPAEFPGRDLILFLAFCAILATLVLQGTTLGPAIRYLGVSEPKSDAVHPAVTPEAIEARSQATTAAIDAVTEQLDERDPEQRAVAQDLLRDLRGRAKQADQMRFETETGGQRLALQMRLRLTAIEAARAKLLADHNDDIGTEATAALVSELDLEEEQIRIALGER
jgi:CPA1 family monovalent cation:H+ antiporter